MLLAPASSDDTVLWWSVILDGIVIAIGASANVVILGLSERAGHCICFRKFTRYGALVALATPAF